MRHECDVLVIGGGAAASRAALEAATLTPNVILVDKGEPGDSGTSPLALHGLATTLHKDDSEAALAKDIIHAGGGINDRDLVRRAAHESGWEPELLKNLGVGFHRIGDGSYDIYRGDGHSLPHGLTFDADENGLNFVAILSKKAAERGVRLVPSVLITDLCIEGGKIVGALGVDVDGSPQVFRAKAVVLAAGGANRIYPNVVPRIGDERYRTTGDALALALKAGLDLVDMEMANFRNSPPASRLGARYINAKGEAFMTRYDPMGEHAPRGTVVACLYQEMQAGNGPIHMEITPESERVAAFSPQEYKDYVAAYKRGERPPVTITFQRLLGGARISDDASTAVAGLFIAGESAGGFHGGDRLQGAAFLETQVFGRLAGLGAARFAQTTGNDAPTINEALATKVPAGTTPADALIEEIQNLAWNAASIVKNAGDLTKALATLEQVRSKIQAGLSGSVFAIREAQNLQITAEAIVRASLLREESRGAHRRSDFPQKNENFARRHTSVRLRDGRMSADWVACRD